MRVVSALAVGLLCTVGLLPLSAAKSAVQRNPVFSGNVNRIVDGRTFRVRVKDGPEVTVQLWGVEAPALDQEFGQDAKRRLSKLVLRKNVVVEDYTGKNGVEVRIGEVYVNVSKNKQFNLNEAMIATGFAKCERLPDNTDLRSSAERLIKAEESARRAKRGLWSRGIRTTR